MAASNSSGATDRDEDQQQVRVYPRSLSGDINSQSDSGHCWLAWLAWLSWFEAVRQFSTCLDALRVTQFKLIRYLLELSFVVLSGTWGKSGRETRLVEQCR